MKKLLAMLGAAGLVVSTSAVLVSCGGGNKETPQLTAKEELNSSILGAQAVKQTFEEDGLIETPKKLGIAIDAALVVYNADGDDLSFNTANDELNVALEQAEKDREIELNAIELTKAKDNLKISIEKANELLTKIKEDISEPAILLAEEFKKSIDTAEEIFKNSTDSAEVIKETKTLEAAYKDTSDKWSNIGDAEAQLVKAKKAKITEATTAINTAKDGFITSEAKALFDTLLDTVTKEINALEDKAKVESYDFATKVEATKVEAQKLDDAAANEELTKAKEAKITEATTAINTAKDGFITSEAKALFDTLLDTVTKEINALEDKAKVESYDFATKVEATKVEAQKLDDAAANEELTKAKEAKITEATTAINTAKDGFTTSEAKALFDTLLDTVTKEINALEDKAKVESYDFATKVEATKVEAQKLDDAAANEELTKAKEAKITEATTAINTAKDGFTTSEAKALFDTLLDTITKEINALEDKAKVESYDFATKVEATKVEAQKLDDAANNPGEGETEEEFMFFYQA